MSSPQKVLLISTDTVDRKMAGPGIRYWNLARVLARQQPVTLATPSTPMMDPPHNVSIVSYGIGTRDDQQRKLATIMADFDIVISQMPPYLHLDEDTLARIHLVIDLYAPWFLEKLEFAHIDPTRGEPLRADDLEILNRLLAIGDYYICASERQRDYWLGALTAAGRLTTDQVSINRELRSLIDVVPLGLTEARPIPTGTGPREIIDGIGRDDPIILWNGGIWNWLDPLTAIRAIDHLARQGMPVRLVFMGTRSPSHEVAEMELASTARELALDLGLLDSHVFFNDWVAYEERQNWLLQASLTLSLHHPTIESRFAFRTRLLDNLWCRVPIVATEGDVLSEIVATAGLGRDVPPGDAIAVAAAIEEVLDRHTAADLRRNIATVARDYTWERVAEPLLRYCLNPHRNPTTHAPDDYLHKLERLYTETAGYARRLEETVEEKNRAIEARQAASRNADPWKERWQRWKRLG